MGRHDRHAAEPAPGPQRKLLPGQLFRRWPVHSSRTTLDERSACIWDVATGALAAMPILHPDWVFHADFSPDGRLVVTACRDRYVRVWDWRTGRLAGSPAKYSRR